MFQRLWDVGKPHGKIFYDLKWSNVRQRQPGGEFGGLTSGSEAKPDVLERETVDVENQTTASRSEWKYRPAGLTWCDEFYGVAGRSGNCRNWPHNPYSSSEKAARIAEEDEY